MRGRLGPVLALTIMGAAALFVVLWASMAGPVSVSTHGPSAVHLPHPPAASSSPTPSPSASSSPGSGGRARGQGFGWIGELVNVVVVVGLCLLGAWLLRRWYDGIARRRRPGRGASAAPTEGVGLDDQLDRGADREAIRAGLAERYADQLAALTRLPPRNGIVQAWVLFEDAAALAGVRRAATETTTEFVVRLLHRLDVDPAAVGRLRGLYVEARFSSHEVGAAQRDQARRALAAIHRELEPVARATSVSGSRSGGVA